MEEGLCVELGLKEIAELDVVANTHHPNTREAETGRLMGAVEQPRLQRETSEDGER